MSLHVLYRMFGHSDELLYVGITCNPPARFKQHAKEKDWYAQLSYINVELHPSRDALEKAEKRAIQLEFPKYNVVHNAKNGSDHTAESYSPIALSQRLDVALEILSQRVTALEMIERRSSQERSLPPYLSKNQFLSITGLSNQKFVLLCDYDQLPEGAYRLPGRNGKWKIPRESALEFTSSEICKLMNRNLMPACVEILRNRFGVNA